ncbi:MAG: DUF6261 family protein [Prevotellaceae bacterium]|jgi:hypothetical protein|nr:DUF6261 family protein [Prevotellaceae bacterium]
MKINSLGTGAMNSGAHFFYMTEIVNKAENTPVVVRWAGTQVNALKKALEAEDAALKLTTKSLFTQEIRAANKQRNTFYSSLRKTVSGFAAVPDMQPAGATLEQMLKDYAYKTNGQIDHNNGMMLNLITDLRGKYAKEVARLGIGIIVDNMETANKQVISLMTQRTEEQKMHVNGALKTARAATDRAYRELVETVNAHVQLEGDANYLDFISFVNAEILHFQRDVLHQKGKPNNAGDPDDGDQNGGGGDDGEEEPPQG